MGKHLSSEENGQVTWEKTAEYRQWPEPFIKSGPNPAGGLVLGRPEQKSIR
jgi:hypothetical protein